MGEIYYQELKMNLKKSANLVYAVQTNQKYRLPK